MLPYRGRSLTDRDEKAVISERIFDSSYNQHSPTPERMGFLLVNR